MDHAVSQSGYLFRFALIIDGVCRAVAAHHGRDRTAGPTIILVCGDVRRRFFRFAKLVELVQLGILPRSRIRRDGMSPAARPASERPRCARLPRGTGFLVKMMQAAPWEITVFGSQLYYWLADPTVAAFLQSYPHGRRILRPVWRLVSTDPLPEALREPERQARSASAEPVKAPGAEPTCGADTSPSQAPGAEPTCSVDTAPSAAAGALPVCGAGVVAPADLLADVAPTDVLADVTSTDVVAAVASTDVVAAVAPTDVVADVATAEQSAGRCVSARGGVLKCVAVGVGQGAEPAATPTRGADGAEARATVAAGSSGAPHSPERIGWARRASLVRRLQMATHSVVSN